MDEIKLRVDVLSRALSGSIDLHGWALAELGYLQLRKICELTALACLVAHGDLIGSQANRFRGDWNLDRIVKGLERLHPDFFPRTLVHSPVVKHGSVIHCDRAETLTKREFIALHASTGKFLHRGSLKTLFSEKTEIANEPLFQGAQKIIDLLSSHIISSPNQGRHFLCYLATAPYGECKVMLAEATEGQ